MTKMKNMIHLAGALFALGAGVAYAAPYGMAGCGLGSSIIKDDGMVQIFAATTNGTSWNQTFGITSGTSNCTKQGVVLTNKEQEAFFEANLQSLQQDMVVGQGEYLNALLQLFACPVAVQPKAAALAQQHFERLFPNEETSPAQALYAYKAVLAGDKALADSCRL